jgi:hypothetical protein
MVTPTFVTNPTPLPETDRGRRLPVESRGLLSVLVQNCASKRTGFPPPPPAGARGLSLSVRGRSEGRKAGVAGEGTKGSGQRTPAAVPLPRRRGPRLADVRPVARLRSLLHVGFGQTREIGRLAPKEPVTPRPARRNV